MPNFNFIDTLKKSSVFPTPIFTILNIAEKLCLRTALYSLYQISTKLDDKGGKYRWKSFTVIIKVWLLLCRLRENCSHSTQFCGHLSNEFCVHRTKLVKNAIEGS
jgi:hypothetical protein